MNYNDEQMRFAQVAQAVEPDPPAGQPGMEGTAEGVQGTRDDPRPHDDGLPRESRRHARPQRGLAQEVHPALPRGTTTGRASKNHGSYFFYWTTADEIAWKNFYRVWMAFLDDYKDMGGRVTVSGDAAFIYSLWGFASIEEMELLQEAGFHPLEVIRSATMYGAQAIFEPKGKEIEFGVLRPGLKADIVLIKENPLANLKVLYGTKWQRLNDKTGKVEWIGGIDYTIKDGIIYDAKALSRMPPGCYGSQAGAERRGSDCHRPLYGHAVFDPPWCGRAFAVVVDVLLELHRVGVVGVLFSVWVRPGTGGIRTASRAGGAPCRARCPGTKAPHHPRRRTG